jgi:hypothetical protein
MQKAESIHLTVPDKLYVGFQGKGTFDKENHTLAFAIAYNDTKAFEKSKSTVDNWAGYNRASHHYDPVTRQSITIQPETDEGGVVIDNEWLTGFQFERSVSRWQTNNKYFEILDPRGFKLQITAENLGDLLLHSQIAGGALIGRFTWTRYKGAAYLVREDHPAWLQQKNPLKREKKSLSIGDVLYFTSEGPNF